MWVTFTSPAWRDRDKLANGQVQSYDSMNNCHMGLVPSVFLSLNLVYVQDWALLGEEGLFSKTETATSGFNRLQSLCAGPKDGSSFFLYGLG